MFKFNRIVAKYLLYSFPAVLIIIVWQIFQNQITIALEGNLIVKVLYEILSLHIVFWFAVLIYFVFVLVFSSSFRGMLLKKMARIKDKDEREDFITGNACKSTFLATLALLIAILFFSIININIEKLPPEKAVDGKTGTISIGLKFKMWDSDALKINSGETKFSLQEMPLTKEGLILFIIIFEIFGYNYFARKQLKQKD